MKKVTLRQQHLADGSISFTITCGLEEVNDIDFNVIENPIRTLVWDDFLQRYVLTPLDDHDDHDRDHDAHDDDEGIRRRRRAEDVTVELGVVVPTDDDDDIDDGALSSSRSSILARECWCARVFQQDARDDDLSSSSSSEPTLGHVLDVTQNALFCPLDTNADGTPTDRDVRICTARAVYARDGSLVDRDSACVAEPPMVEFSKSSWPLCFFWWILLVYALVATAYGRRVRCYLWRNLAVACVRLGDCLTGRTRRRRRRERERERERELSSGGPADDDDEERGGDDDDDDGSVVPPEEEEREREEPSVEDLFGTRANRELLGRELDHQAERTRNEYVTWLWYSAIYTEVRRYRYERFQEQRRRRRRAGRISESGAGDDGGDDDEPLGGGGTLNGRTLDRVYWWPPSGPNGSRWEHLRGRQDAVNHPGDLDPRLDPTRLCLKTRVFSLPEPTTKTKGKEEEDVDDGEGSSGSVAAAIAVTDVADEEASATAPASGGDGEGGNLPSVADVDSIEGGTCCSGGDDHLPPPPVDVDDDDVPDNTCSICLTELEEGDIVGDIPCGHTFRKDCLKAWLVKNNHCPICRMPMIAYHPPRRPRRSSTTTSTTSNNNDGTTTSDGRRDCPPPRRRGGGGRSRRTGSGGGGVNRQGGGGGPPAHTLSVVARFEAEPM